MLCCGWRSSPRVPLNPSRLWNPPSQDAIRGTRRRILKVALEVYNHQYHFSLPVLRRWATWVCCYKSSANVEE